VQQQQQEQQRGRGAGVLHVLQGPTVDSSSSGHARTAVAMVDNGSGGGSSGGGNVDGADWSSVASLTADMVEPLAWLLLRSVADGGATSSPLLPPPLLGSSDELLVNCAAARGGTEAAAAAAASTTQSGVSVRAADGGQQETAKGYWGGPDDSGRTAAAGESGSQGRRRGCWVSWAASAPSGRVRVRTHLLRTHAPAAGASAAALHRTPSQSHAPVFGPLALHPGLMQVRLDWQPPSDPSSSPNLHRDDQSHHSIARNACARLIEWLGRCVLNRCSAHAQFASQHAVSVGIRSRQQEQRSALCPLRMMMTSASLP
jgi:hypothetical protein